MGDSSGNHSHSPANPVLVEPPAAPPTTSAASAALAAAADALVFIDKFQPRNAYNELRLAQLRFAALTVAELDGIKTKPLNVTTQMSEADAQRVDRLIELVA